MVWLRGGLERGGWLGVWEASRKCGARGADRAQRVGGGGVLPVLNEVGEDEKQLPLQSLSSCGLKWHFPWHAVKCLQDRNLGM